MNIGRTLRRISRWAPNCLASLCLFTFPVAGSTPAGPSFDCKRATSKVNRLICASDELSALDRKLAEDYGATLHQGGIDGNSLQVDEAEWLRGVRNQCMTATCLEDAYRARDEAILDLSLRVASPAAYEDTRPFLTDSSALSAARSRIGSSCGGAPAQALPGTSIIEGFQSIVVSGGYIVPLSVGGYPFAFLLAPTGAEAGHCSVLDVVALPPSAVGNSFMQCHLRDDSHGFAVRSSKGKVLAYWSVASDVEKLRREPIHVIGDQDLRCHQPEAGE